MDIMDLGPYGLSQWTMFCYGVKFELQIQGPESCRIYFNFTGGFSALIFYCTDGGTL